MEVERPLIDYSDTTEEGEILMDTDNQNVSTSSCSSSEKLEKKRKRDETEEDQNSSPKKEARSSRHEEKNNYKERSHRSKSRERSGHHQRSSHRSDKHSNHRSRSRSHSKERREKDKGRDRSKEHKDRDHSKERRNRDRDYSSERSDRERNSRHSSSSSKERSYHESVTKRDERPKEKSEAKDKESSSFSDKKINKSNEVSLSSSNSLSNSNSKIKENENSLKGAFVTTEPTSDIIYQKKVKEALKTMEEESEEEKIRKARERRRAIMLKYSQQQAEQPHQDQVSIQRQPSESSLEIQIKTKDEGLFSPTESTNGMNLSSSQILNENSTSRLSSSPSLSPPSSPFRLEQTTEQTLFDESTNQGEQEEPEMQDESLANEKLQALNPSFGPINVNNNNNTATTSLPQKSKDDFDMFSDSPDLSPVSIPKIPTKAAITTENVDDADGYYCYRVGEVLNGRFILLGSYGKGVFSTVIRSTDQEMGKEVAVKILRNNEAMKRMGLKEIELLKQISDADPEGKYNCVKLIHHFEDRNHLCLVFEALGGGNLREVLRKYGNKIGLKIQAVKVFGHKLMLALKLLKKLKIFHADLKPDNILVNETKTSVKLADFGSASPVTENSITPFLVSRWYRAPEIMLGLPYSYEIDMWSLGCTLFEIATGKVLFSGKSNNEMLYLIMEVSGPVPKKMIKKGAFAAENFDENGNFKRYMKDKISDKEYIKVCQITQPTRDLKAELLNSPYQLSADEKKMLTNLHDLLMKIFVFDPARRISVHDALRHPFFAK